MQAKLPVLTCYQLLTLQPDFFDYTLQREQQLEDPE